MATKNAKTEAPAAPVVIEGFQIDEGVTLPEITGRGATGKPNPYRTVMERLKQGQSFFIPAKASDNLAGEERTKALKENQREITNKISQLSRRLYDVDSSKGFATRTREENGVVGVRVFCVAPTPPKPRRKKGEDVGAGAATAQAQGAPAPLPTPAPPAV